METEASTITNRVTLEVFNPRGTLPSLKMDGLFAPRIKDLAGKRIAFLTEKQTSDIFFDALKELLREKYPTAEFMSFPSMSAPMQPDNTKEVAEKCDAWIYGMKTSGSSSIDAEAKLERLGKPGVALSVSCLVPQRRRLAMDHGMPALRILPVPDDAFLVAYDMEGMRPVAAAVFDDIIKALTAPLTDAEKNPEPEVIDYGPIQFTGKSEHEAYEKFQQYFADQNMGDGLALAPPRREAVEWMLTGTTRSRDEEIGRVEPRLGMATIEKIAVNSVMAGARPEYLPVIIAAVECMTAKEFNLYHLQTGTASAVPVIWVNGPIAEEIGMSGKMGYLGPGFRANSSIGRAVSLCMHNIGWCLNEADSGLTGQPEGYCNFIFPENEAASPWAPFHVDQGFSPEDSTVTVNSSFTYNRFGPGGGMSAPTLQENLDLLAEMVKNSMKGGMIASKSFEIVLYPSFAKQLAEAGYTKKSLVQWLFDNSRYSWDEMDPFSKEFLSTAIKQGWIQGITEEDCKPGGRIPPFSNPNNIAILVSGDWTGYCVIYSTPVNSTFMAGPGAPNFMTKRIHGAALTKAGR